LRKIHGDLLSAKSLIVGMFWNGALLKFPVAMQESSVHQARVTTKLISNGTEVNLRSWSDYSDTHNIE
jgi:hypothetical protein